MKKLLTACGILLLCCLLACASADPEFTFRPTEDSSGCLNTGCSEFWDETLTIPAELDGLPVAGVEPGAFSGMYWLRRLETEPGQTFLSSVDGFLTDMDGKTLLTVPAGLTFVRIPDGIETIGEKAFCNMFCRDVYIPDSVKKIGHEAFTDCGSISLLEGRGVTELDKPIHRNTDCTVYAPGNGLLMSYAWENGFSCFPCDGPVEDFTVPEFQEAKLPPFRTDTENAPAPSGKPVPVQNADLDQDIGSIIIQQTGTVQAEQMAVPRKLFAEFCPRQERMDGVYGAGYTGGESVLRFYDAENRLVAWQEVSGSFAFRFEEAEKVSIEKAKDLKLFLFPASPVFSDGNGVWHPSEGTWIKLENGVSAQYVVIPQSYVVMSYKYANDYYATMLLPYFYDTGLSRSDKPVETWRILVPRVTLEDYVVPGGTMNYFRFQTVNHFELAGLDVTAPQDFDLPVSFTEKLPELWSSVKEAVLPYLGSCARETKYALSIAENLYPYFLDSEVPPTIELNEDSCFLSEEENWYALSHEGTHALEYMDPVTFSVTSSPWHEGFAEMISLPITIARFPGRYNWYEDPGFDWSFLSEEARADFGHTFCLHLSHEMAYPVGYKFLTWLRDTYGVEAFAAFHEAVNSEMAPVWESNGGALWLGEEEKAEIFIRCLKAVTSEDVFNRFVAEVVK